MTSTFTPNLNETTIKLEKDYQNQFPDFVDPSKNVINNILNFSKNLDVKKSRFVDAIEIMKS